MKKKTKSKNHLPLNLGLVLDNYDNQSSPLNRPNCWDCEVVTVENKEENCYSTTISCFNSCTSKGFYTHYTNCGTGQWHHYGI